jgi:hypothetical protein
MYQLLQSRILLVCSARFSKWRATVPKQHYLIGLCYGDTTFELDIITLCTYINSCVIATVYLHFPTLYPLSNRHLPEGRAYTVYITLKASNLSVSVIHSTLFSFSPAVSFSIFVLQTVKGSNQISSSLCDSILAPVNNFTALHCVLFQIGNWFYVLKNWSDYCTSWSVVPRL